MIQIQRTCFFLHWSALLPALGIGVCLRFITLFYLSFWVLHPFFSWCSLLALPFFLKLPPMLAFFRVNIRRPQILVLSFLPGFSKWSLFPELEITSFSWWVPKIHHLPILFLALDLNAYKSSLFMDSVSEFINSLKFISNMKINTHFCGNSWTQAEQQKIWFSSCSVYAHSWLRSNKAMTCLLVSAFIL